MIRSLTSVVFFVLCVASSARAQGAHDPASIKLDGTAALSLVAQARRVHLLGAVEIYTLALYADGEILDRAHLASPDTPKALRIEITYEEDVRRPIALDWRRELIPRLDAAATTHLRGIFAPLRQGDVVMIEYAPAKGTTVRVNKGVGGSGAHHDLMLAFLDHWLGQHPVSEEIKRTLLGSSFGIGA
jgi:Chalcone isomerase-like